MILLLLPESSTWSSSSCYCCRCKQTWFEYRNSRYMQEGNRIVMVNVEANNNPRIWNTRWTERQRDREARTHTHTQTKAHTHFELVIALPWASSLSPSIRQIADVVFWKMLSAWLDRERVAVVVEAWVAGRRACVQSSFVGPPATFTYAHYSSSSAAFARYVLDLSLSLSHR
jgi:hypothetical protein